MELKQQDEKLFKIYTSCLVSSEMPHTLDIEQVKLCLVPDEQLEEGKNQSEQLLQPKGGTGLQQPLTFELKDILQSWLKDFIKKNSRYQQQDLKLFEVIEPDSILSFEHLVITPRITQNLHDLNGGLSGKVIMETIRGKSYFIYESADHKLFYINPNALISGISGIGFEVNEELSSILKKKINLKKNIQLLVRNQNFYYQATRKDEPQPIGVSFSILDKPVSFLSRFNENNSDTVFSTPVSDEIIKKINDIQRNTSYNEFQIRHSGEDIRLMLHSQALGDSLEIHRFHCGTPALDRETVYHLEDYLFSTTAKSFSLLKNGVFIVDLHDDSLVIIICKTEKF